MTENLNPEFAHQTAVFNQEFERLLWGTDDEFLAAADALVRTAVGRRTGYALALGLASVAHTLVAKITELGQVPVTAFHPRTPAELDDMILAARFMQAASDRAANPKPSPDEKPETLVIFDAFEADETGRSMAGLFGFLTITLREMGQQVRQAAIDAEAR